MTLPTRRRWLTVGVIAWAVLVAVLAFASARTDPPTVPDQADLVDALPVVERATGELFAAVGAAGIAEIGPLEVSTGCRLTAARAGVRAHREVTVHVPEGSGPALLERVAATLPAGYGAYAAGGDKPTLRADAGAFVVLRGTVEQSGTVVRLRAATGCRPTSGPLPSAPSLGADAESAPQLVALLSDLRLPATGPAVTHQVACPTGGVARTETVVVEPAPADLAAALRPMVGDATLIRAEASGYAYRKGAASIVVTVVEGRLRLAVTTGC